MLYIKKFQKTFALTGRGCNLLPKVIWSFLSIIQKGLDIAFHCDEGAHTISVYQDMSCYVHAVCRVPSCQK